MKMNELKLVYFSPTGATRKAVMETARNIDLKSVSFDFSVYKEKKPVLKFAHNDLAVFGIPVYYGRVPALFMEYLQNISGDNTPAALIATYGCREYEDALLELKNTVNSLDFRCIGAVAAVARHSIVDSIASFRPDLQDSAQLSAFFDKIQDKIRTLPSPGTQSPEKRGLDSGTGTDKILDFYVPGNFPYKEINLVQLVPELTGDCSFCGVCARRCPVKAISPENYAQVDSKKCISCMRCLRICTRKARSLPPEKLQPLAARLEKLCSDRKQNELFL